MSSPLAMAKPLLRLLPLCFALLVGGCLGPVGDSVTGVFAQRAPGQVRGFSMLVASTRPKAKDDTEQASAQGARFYRQAVSVPPGHEAGVIEQPTFGKANPLKHIVLGERVALDPSQAMVTASSLIDTRASGQRDVLVFVHGFNTSYREAALRLTQLVADTGFDGLPVLFTWPSYSKLFAYAADREEATASRDAMEALLKDLGRLPGVGRIHVLAHSMGSFVAMEGLRQAAIAGDATLSGHLGEIILAAPDLDIAVFKAQMARINAPGKVSLFVQAKDRALAASSTVAYDRQRLGALDVRDPAHRAAIAELGVRIFTMEAGGWTDLTRHGTFAEAPQIVRLIGARMAQPVAVAAVPATEQPTAEER